LHRLFAPGSDRAAEKWKDDYAIEGVAGLDSLEEALFARRRDLFSDLDIVFFDTPSICFEGQGGETIGRHGRSKDYRPDGPGRLSGLNALENKRRILDCNSGMSHRVRFSCWLSGGVWFYRFIDTGLTPLGAARKTCAPETIRSLADRGVLPNFDTKLMLDLGIKMGQGGSYLALNDEQ
jgi:hypothetical protein